ncbi:MAG: hypothetical protein AB1485_05745 [Candidatus Thermoplasmatota archaeon]
MQRQRVNIDRNLYSKCIQTNLSQIENFSNHGVRWLDIILQDCKSYVEEEVNIVLPSVRLAIELSPYIARIDLHLQPPTIKLDSNTISELRKLKNSSDKFRSFWVPIFVHELVHLAAHVKKKDKSRSFKLESLSEEIWANKIVSRLKDRYPKIWNDFLEVSKTVPAEKMPRFEGDYASLCRVPYCSKRGIKKCSKCGHAYCEEHIKIKKHSPCRNKVAVV